MNNNAIINNVPAAGGLHKIPGFDPLKYLRKTTNAQGEPVLRLDLSYKKLWFRLACPNGRMLLNPLRVTDQMALMEAKVFFDRGDETPVSSFTANKAARESGNYIRDAQDEALNVALDNAGFGIQLCDVAGMPASQYGSDIPVSRVKAEAAQTTAEVQTAPAPQMNTAQPEAAAPATAPVQERKVAVQENPVVQQQKPAPVAAEQPKTEAPASPAQTRQVPAESTQASQPTVQKEQQPPVQEQVSPAPAQETVQVQEEAAEINEPNPQPEAQKNNLHEVVDLLAQMAKSDAQASETAAPAQDAPAAAASAPAAPSYTADMPVEEICKKMTLEEALAVVVPSGACKGWTMAQVTEKRRASLKFYVYSQGSVDNVVKAAATLLWNDLELKKAG